MNPVFGALLVLLACAYLWGCADVQERSHIVGGRTGTPLTASVGDSVLRVAREKNLPNIAGKADIFGRTTPTGVETVQSGVNVTNLTETSGGSDPETDEQYRYRIWLLIESYSTCGPRDAYEFWALSAHPDIIQCVVYSAPDIAGEVWLYPLLKNGVLPSPLILGMVEAVCSADTRRPVTDFVTAKVAAVVPYTLDMDYYVLTENERLLASIVSNVNQAAADWMLWQKSKISRDINGNELAKRCLQAGAKRIVINSPTPSFQVLEFNELAVHGDDTEPIVHYSGLEDA